MVKEIYQSCFILDIVFTDEVIAGQTFAFISGGTETVASVLSFAFYELAVNKDIQKRLQDEIDSILQQNGFTYKAVRKMTYLDQVLNEVLRQRTAGVILQRVCLQDYKFPGTNLTIEKGQLIQIPVQAIHHDPQYYPDPEKFDPDRFKNMEDIPKGLFFPFGGGPRICIAMRLAMLEMKVFITTILSSYNVELSEKTKLPLKLIKTSILQRVVGGMWVRFQPRK